jgi:hypothetical protein
VSRPVLVDLDEITAEDLDRLVGEQRWRHAARRADPEIYQAIIERLDGIDPEEADQIRAELGRAVHPWAVLAGHWRSLIPDRPALGAYLTGTR